MSYELPRYVTEAGIADDILRFEWDDRQVSEYRLYGSEDVAEKLAAVTPRAMMAAAIGIYEWIICRFRSISDDPVPFQVAEAMWCGNIHSEYARYFELDRREWIGTIRSPLWSATTLLSEMLFFRGEEEEPEARVAYLSNLALHVLPQSEAFVAWRHASVERIVSLYTVPSDADPFEDLFGDVGGPLVPREVLDPTFDFGIEMTETLIDQFLRKVDYSSNWFLRAPEELLKEGFEGTPYRIGNGGAAEE